MKAYSATQYKTHFDRVFIEIVEYLIKHKTDITGISNKKELLLDLGTNPSNYTDLKNGKRGVPINKIDSIKKKFIEKYNINPEYIRARKGTILSTPIVSEPDAAYVNYQVEKLKLEIENLKALLVEKDKLIEMQQLSITTLEEMVRMFKRNVGEN